MQKKGMLVLAVGAALLGGMGARASAQGVAAYVAVPPVYVQIGPAPGPGYVWVPEYRRWEYRRVFVRDFYRDRAWDRWRGPREYGRRDYERDRR